MPRCRVVFLANGTRGDVQPCAILAAHVRQALQGDTAHLHADAQVTTAVIQGTRRACTGRKCDPHAAPARALEPNPTLVSHTHCPNPKAVHNLNVSSEPKSKPGCHSTCGTNPSRSCGTCLTSEARVWGGAEAKAGAGAGAEVTAADAVDVVFVTHSAHRALLEPYLNGNGVAFQGIMGPPARVWRTHTGSADQPQAKRPRLSPELGSVQGPNCTSDPDPGTDPSQSSEVQERLAMRRLRLQRKAYVAACQGACCVVFNLFSLAGWHVADSLGCPSVAVSPCLIPYACPVAFKRQIRAEFPGLYWRLQSACGVDAEPAGGSAADPSCSLTGSLGPTDAPILWHTLSTDTTGGVGSPNRFCDGLTAASKGACQA